MQRNHRNREERLFFRLGESMSICCVSDLDGVLFREETVRVGFSPVRPCKDRSRYDMERLTHTDKNKQWQ